jgi:malonyl-CoA O-methyltransferase
VKDVLNNFRKKFGRKPRVLILADLPGWAYDTNSKGIQKALADDFEIEIAYLHHGASPDPRPDFFDIYHICCWVDIVHHWNIDPQRIVKEVSSHRWEDVGEWGPLSPKQFCAKHLADAGVITATSRRLQEVVGAVRPVLLAPNGVSDFFELGPDKAGDLVFGWSGKASDPCKGLYDILQPASYRLIDLKIAPGNVAHEEMGQFYQKLDVLCVASTKEGEPLPLLEGMRCGCFPICTDVGIVPELVRNGENGLIVERSPEAFRKAFKWCLEHPEEVRAAGRANGDYIQRTRSWDRVKGAWRRAWCEALQHYKPRDNAERIVSVPRDEAAPSAKNKKEISLIARFYKCLAWVDAHTLSSASISVSSAKKIPYPEVSGYYIPTLIAWGERERAIEFGRRLLAIQREDGSFSGPDDDASYVFDTGQVVRGLLELARNELLDCTHAIIKACTWITSFVKESGEIECPDLSQWSGNAVPAGVLLYALEPVRRAAEWLKREDMVVAVDRCVAYFLRLPALTDFTCLSHFHAYILEALFDLGHVDLCSDGMNKVLSCKLSDGGLPAYRGVSWVCSTGMFQYAGILYKMGRKSEADACFVYMTSFQNVTGGWFGSYGVGKTYFPDAEISWAGKYFLDAFLHKLRSSFEEQAPRFLSSIAADDGRYLFVKQQIETVLERNTVSGLSVLDVGCGKGRYLARLANESYAARLILNGSDLSADVLSYVPAGISTRQGSCLNLPYPDMSVDVVFSCEALEHCVYTEGALRELWRVVKPGGVLLIIDKNSALLGNMRILETEQWFETKAVRDILASLGGTVSAHEGVPCEGRNDALFTAWVSHKKPQGLTQNLSFADWNKVIVGAAEPRAMAGRVVSGDVPEWISVLLAETRLGDACLELGSGSGLLSASLAKQGRKTSLLDFSADSLVFSQKLYNELNISGEFIHADVLEPLPFDDGVFDCVWSSGLLEHFSDAEIQHIVSDSARISKGIVLSLVPNAASIPYRLGKWHQEEIGEWQYGYEDPKYSVAHFFEKANLKNIREYTVSWLHALNFMSFDGAPDLRRLFEKWYATLREEDHKMLNQGYLLVTVGVKSVLPGFKVRK